MKFTHVHQAKDGVLTGNFTGHETESEARGYIDTLRWSRDNSPVFAEFKRGGYDWHIVEFEGESGSHRFVY